MGLLMSPIVSSGGGSSGGSVTIPISVSDGGTGITSYTIGDLLYAPGTTTLSKLADVATGSVIISGGVGVAPSWSSSPTVTTLTGSTSVLTPLLDAASAGALNIGTTTATAVNIGRSAQSIGFFGTTATTQQVDGYALTNNVTNGGILGKIANYTDLSVYANDANAIRNNLYQITAKLKIIDDALRAYGLLT